MRGDVRTPTRQQLTKDTKKLVRRSLSQRHQAASGFHCWTRGCSLRLHISSIAFAKFLSLVFSEWMTTTQESAAEAVCCQQMAKEARQRRISSMYFLLLSTYLCTYLHIAYFIFTCSLDVLININRINLSLTV